MKRQVGVAVALAVGAVGYIVYGAHVVQRQLDAAGVPGCLDPNVCYPHGAAMDAVFGMELTAALVPALIGLVLGVPLFTRGASREPSALRGALLAGLVLTGAVALTHRLLGARYTVLANDTYELWQMLHLNNVAFMVMMTLVITALGGVFGLLTGKVAPTLALTVVAWPFALITAYVGVGLLSVPLRLLAGSGEGGRATGSFADDIGLADGVGYAGSVVLALSVAGLVLIARRVRRT